MSELTFKTQIRNSLYYGQYEYAGRFYLENSSCLRNLDLEQVQSRIRMRKYNQLPSQADFDIENILDLRERLTHNFQQPNKRISNYDHMYLYTNNLLQLQNIMSAQYLTKKSISCAQVSLPSNVVLLKNPKHQYRTYFKEKWLEINHGVALAKFLLSRQDCYGYTPGFKYHLTQYNKITRYNKMPASYVRRFCLRSHYFVDHDSPGDALMLAMICPGIVRKTLPIQTK